MANVRKLVRAGIDCIAEVLGNECPLLSINGGTLIKAIPNEARKGQDYDPLVYDPAEQVEVVVSTDEFMVGYPNNPRTYLKKSAKLDDAEWRVVEIAEGAYAHTITLGHIDKG